MEDAAALSKGEKTAYANLLLDFYGELLTDGQRQALEYFYGEDLTLSEIAQITGITRQGVRDRIVKGESMLYHTEERLGLVERFLKQKEALAEIGRELEALRPICGERLDRVARMIEEML